MPTQTTEKKNGCSDTVEVSKEELNKIYWEIKKTARRTKEAAEVLFVAEQALRYQNLMPELRRGAHPEDVKLAAESSDAANMTATIAGEVEEGSYWLEDQAERLHKLINS